MLLDQLSPSLLLQYNLSFCVLLIPIIVCQDPLGTSLDGGGGGGGERGREGGGKGRGREKKRMRKGRRKGGGGRREERKRSDNVCSDQCKGGVS